VDWLRTGQVGGEKSGLTEDRSSGWYINVDWLRTGQVGGA
jgi:hypothetical protein